MSTKDLWDHSGLLAKNPLEEREQKKSAEVQSLYQGLENSLGSNTPTVLVNKVLLETNHIIYLHFIYGCFLLQQQDLVIETKSKCPQKPKIFTLWPFTGK